MATCLCRLLHGILQDEDGDFFIQRVKGNEAPSGSAATPVSDEAHAQEWQHGFQVNAWFCVKVYRMPACPF